MNYRQRRVFPKRRFRIANVANNVFEQHCAQRRCLRSGTRRNEYSAEKYVLCKPYFTTDVHEPVESNSSKFYPPKENRRQFTPREKYTGFN